MTAIAPGWICRGCNVLHPDTERECRTCHYGPPASATTTMPCPRCADAIPAGAQSHRCPDGRTWQLGAPPVPAESRRTAATSSQRPRLEQEAAKLHDVLVDTRFLVLDTVAVQVRTLERLTSGAESYGKVRERLDGRAALSTYSESLTPLRPLMRVLGHRIAALLDGPPESVGPNLTAIRAELLAARAALQRIEAQS